MVLTRVIWEGQFPRSFAVVRQHERDRDMQGPESFDMTKIVDALLNVSRNADTIPKTQEALLRIKTRDGRMLLTPMTPVDPSNEIFYITTAINYTNGVPALERLGYCTIFPFGLLLLIFDSWQVCFGGQESRTWATHTRLSPRISWPATIVCTAVRFSF
jgi:hypothetical protein